MNFKANRTLWIAVGIFVIVALGLLLVWKNSTSNSFRCPNAYGTAEEYVTGVTVWASGELANSPSMTKEELLSKRQKLFIENKCEPSRWSNLPGGL